MWFAVLRPNNYGSQYPGDHGAHGAFDARARSWSPQLWTSEHRGWIATTVVALALLGVLALFKNKHL